MDNENKAGQSYPHPIFGGLKSITKKWEEITDSEKIERLKSVLENNKYLVSRIAELEKKIHRLELHTHDEKTGEATIKLERVRNDYRGDSAMTQNPLA